MRRIIQIAVVQETQEYIGTVYALCDDGTLWLNTIDCRSDWHDTKPIPQDKPHENKITFEKYMERNEK